jgi:hypothetical protein
MWLVDCIDQTKGARVWRGYIPALLPVGAALILHGKKSELLGKGGTPLDSTESYRVVDIQINIMPNQDGVSKALVVVQPLQASSTKDIELENEPSPNAVDEPSVTESPEGSQEQS